MRTALKIVWKVLQIALLIVPYVVAYFMQAGATYAGGFMNFYLIASAVALGLLVLLALYDEYADEISTFMVWVKVILFIVIAVFGFVFKWSGLNFTPSFFVLLGGTFFVGLALYFLYMLLPFFNFEIFFTVLAIVPSVFVFALGGLEYEAIETVHTVCVIAAGASLLLFVLFHKLMDALSDKFSGGSRTKYVDYDAVVRAVTGFNNEYRGRYAAGVQVSGGTIYVTLTDNHGGKAYGSDAAKLQTYLQNRLHVNVDNSNIYIRY